MDRFPDSLISFQRMFPDDHACAAWLVSVRWPEGFECPRCGHPHGWALNGKAHTFECAGCHRQTSVTAGTILHGSKLAPYPSRDETNRTVSSGPLMYDDPVIQDVAPRVMTR